MGRLLNSWLVAAALSSSAYGGSVASRSAASLHCYRRIGGGMVTIRWSGGFHGPIGR